MEVVPVPTMEKFPLKGANNLSTSSTVVGSHPLSGDHPTYQAVGRNKVSFCTATDRRAHSSFYHYINGDAPRAVAVLTPRPTSSDLSLSGQTCCLDDLVILFREKIIWRYDIF